MLVGSEDKFADIEIVNLAGLYSQSCDSIDELTQPLTYATGGFLMPSQQAVVCGGEIVTFGLSIHTDVSNECYAPGNPVKVGTMLKKRKNAASVVLFNDRLWITGKSIK